MNRRVVVTGLGAITPIGNNVPEFWSAVKQQKVGIGEITHFDATDYKCHLAAEVKDFDAKEYMDFRSAKRMEAFCQFAVAAAGEALEVGKILIDSRAFPKDKMKKLIYQIVGSSVPEPEQKHIYVI